MKDQMNSFIRSYIESMLWAETDRSDDQGGEPLDRNYGLEDIANKTMEQIIADCNSFLEKAENTVSHLLDDYGLTQIAHDFWLTRRHHGAGFWDGDYKEPDATQLTELAQSFKEVSPYIGDDGKIYLD